MIRRCRVCGNGYPRKYSSGPVCVVCLTTPGRGVVYREPGDVAGGGKLPRCSNVVVRSDVDREAVRLELERTHEARHAELRAEELERAEKLIDLRAAKKRREREKAEQARKLRRDRPRVRAWQGEQMAPLNAEIRARIIEQHEGRAGKPQGPGDLKAFLHMRHGGDEFRANLLELEHGRDALELIVRCCLGKVGTVNQSRAAARMLRRTLERDRASELCHAACWAFRRFGAPPLVLPAPLASKGDRT